LFFGTDQIPSASRWTHKDGY